MNIEHTTHSEVRSGRPGSRPRRSSAAKKVKDYFSACLHSTSSSQEGRGDLRDSSIERPMTTWPRIGSLRRSSASPKTAPNIIAYLTQQPVSKKEEIQKPARSGADGNGLHTLTEKRKRHTTEKESTPETCLQSSRRKSTSRSKESPNIRHTTYEQVRSTPKLRRKAPFSNQSADVATLQELRLRMREGKMERVVPPSDVQVQGQRARSRTIPPELKNDILRRDFNPNTPLSARRPQSPFGEHREPEGSSTLRPKRSDETSRSSRCQSTSNQSYRHPVGHKKTASTSRVAEYISASADILDEARRELTSRFKPPFEHLRYPSLSLSLRNSICDSSSDESFFCVGERQTHDDGGETKRPEQRQTGSGAIGMSEKKKLSGEGTNPWSGGPLAQCRLCKRKRAWGLRGLCEECERDFMRPRTGAFETHSANDMRLTRPSRVGMAGSPRTGSAKNTFGLDTSSSDEYGEHKRATRLKHDEHRMRKERFKRKSVFYSEESEEDGKSRKIAPEDMLIPVSAGDRPRIVEPTAKMVASQVALVEEGDHNEAEDEERYLGWMTEESKEATKRRTTFYGFWDDILDGDRIYASDQRMEGAGELQQRDRASVTH